MIGGFAMAPLVLLVLLLPLAAATPGPPGTPVPERLARLEAHEMPPLPEGPALHLTPLQREIRVVLEASRARREALLAAGVAAEDAVLVELRRTTRLRVLAIQERHAVKEGRLELARRIRAELDALHAAAPTID